MSRLRVYVYDSKGHVSFLLYRLSNVFRSEVSLAATFGFEMYTRNLTKAYVNPETKWRRSVYMNARAEIQVAEMSPSKVVQHIFGMPVSPMLWLGIYPYYYRDGLKMKQLPLESCLSSKREVCSLKLMFEKTGTKW